jgi:hypothetical protein
MEEKWNRLFGELQEKGFCDAEGMISEDGREWMMANGVPGARMLYELVEFTPNGKICCLTVPGADGKWTYRRPTWLSFTSGFDPYLPLEEADLDRLEETVGGYDRDWREKATAAQLLDDEMDTL